VIPRGQERTEALAADPTRVSSIVSSGKPVAAVRLGHLVAEHRADRAVDVADARWLTPRTRSPCSSAGAAPSIEPAVEGTLEAVVLGVGGVPCRRSGQLDAGARIGDRSSPEAFQCSIAVDIEQLDVADGLLEGAEAQLGEQLADLLGDELEEVLDELGLAGEAGAELGVLGGDADRAGVEVADAHHDAARHHEGRGGETELLGAEQRRDDHVAAGLQLTVDLHDDAVAQAVEQQRLLGLGQAELPRARRRA
jgi:hypothetical protein